jgi:O-antigen ligase
VEALVRHKQSTDPGLLVIVLWSGGAVLAVAFGVAVATSVTAVAGLLGLLAVSAVIAAVVTATRWALIVLLFLLYSYAGWVVGHAVGLPEISQPLLLLIIAAVAWRRLSKDEEFSLPGELTALLVLGLMLTASATVAADLGVNLSEISDFVGYALTIVALVALLDRPVWLRRAVWSVVIAGGALAIINLAQAVTSSYAFDFAGFAIARPEGAGTFRVGGPLDPNFFGQMLIATAILALYLALSARRSAGRALALTMFAACVVTTGLTGSRGTLVAAAAGLFLILLLAPIPRALVAATVALVVAAGLVFLPAGLKARVGVPVDPATSYQVATVTKGSEGAVRGREIENIAALHMFEDHPLLGVGPGNYAGNYLRYTQDVTQARLTQRQAHSLYLAALAETGIAGTGALLAVLWLALCGAWRGRRWLGGGDALLAEGILVALVSFLVASLFLHAAYPRYLWILVGFGFVAGQLARNEATRGRTPA